MVGRRPTGRRAHARRLPFSFPSNGHIYTYNSIIYTESVTVQIPVYSTVEYIGGYPSYATCNQTNQVQTLLFSPLLSSPLLSSPLFSFLSTYTTLHYTTLPFSGTAVCVRRYASCVMRHALCVMRYAQVQVQARSGAARLFRFASFRFGE